MREARIRFFFLRKGKGVVAPLVMTEGVRFVQPAETTIALHESSQRTACRRRQEVRSFRSYTFVIPVRENLQLPFAVRTGNHGELLFPYLHVSPTGTFTEVHFLCTQHVYGTLRLFSNEDLSVSLCGRNDWGVVSEAIERRFLKRFPNKCNTYVHSFKFLKCSQRTSIWSEWLSETLCRFTLGTFRLVLGAFIWIKGEQSFSFFSFLEKKKRNACPLSHTIVCFYFTVLLLWGQLCECQ